MRRGRRGDGALSAPTDAEARWRDEQIATAARLAAHYTGATEDLPSLDRLDACVAAWLDDGDAPVDESTFANAVGAALGAHLAAATGVRWVVANQHGGDLALHWGPRDVLLFPAYEVGKRLRAGERAFVRALYDETVAGAARARRD